MRVSEAVCVCKRGFYQDTENNTCSPCDEECSECVEEGTCTKCKGQFTKVSTEAGKEGTCECIEGFE